MKSLPVNFNEATQAVERIDNASQAPWVDICERFNNDVRRIKTVSDPEGYNALYACYDDDNQPVYYLVEEGEALAAWRHRTFLDKLGRTRPAGSLKK
ncbi:MAG: hypothetical protein V2I40_10065 [Desulfobacteraceae bacterium]|jgi:hypothetical protein|nr:hypothetical protein [Desulfobacteraceae bacterium]